MNYKTKYYRHGGTGITFNRFSISTLGMLPLLWVLCLIVSVLAPLAPVHAADDSLCAHVKMEIAQALTLERQAFDAHMRINNGMTHLPLENVAVEVNFADEEGNPVTASFDPDNQDAVFFIRIDSMENITDIQGNGSVQPSTSADIHWLIIPSPGASKGNPQGTLYYVGATLSYTVGAQEENIHVAPDYIFVKPMPEIAIDYFLPGQVYGDDAFTPEIEAPVPFSLGMRAKNNGSGIAKEFRVDSAQPEIVDNELGLLIGFKIQGCEVNNDPATPSLNVNIGDIEPGAAGTARWIMSCSLSGEFTKFTAEFSHSDELGGELTSLIQQVATHRLVRNVLVDQPGRDNILDFLARDGESLFMVYESEGIDTLVTDQSENAQFAPEGTEGSYTLSVPVTAGFMMVSIPDPFPGQKVISEVIRSDGKRISTDNAWLSKTRVKDGPWQHFFNLFDFNTTASYIVVFAEAPSMPHAPALQFIPDGQVVEGEQIAFVVEASDPDGTVPRLTAGPIPAGADFTDSGNGQGTFDWTPEVGQAGLYPVTFAASDSSLEDSQLVTIKVCPQWDSDCDSMADDWEMEHFHNLDRNGSNDADSDGISDLHEFLNGTDPLASENAPSIPEIISPLDGAEITELQPELIVANSIDPDGNTLSYIFELYSDSGYSLLVHRQDNVSEGEDSTSCTLPDELQDNHWYYWRVKVTDGYAFSQWAYGRFFVNTENDPPGSQHASSPWDGTQVDTLTPTLQITNAVDVDQDSVSCMFEVFSDDTMNNLVVSSGYMPQGQGGTTSWTIPVPLDPDTTYYWHTSATDEHGAVSLGAPCSFHTNTANNASDAPVISAPISDSEISSLSVDLVVENSSDPDGHSLVYIFQVDTTETFDSIHLITSPVIEEADGVTVWHVGVLEDNTQYYWRVKASDGDVESRWTRATFFVNTANDEPPIPVILNPGSDAWVDTLRPEFSVASVRDIDHDLVTYHFEIYTENNDGILQNLVAETETSDMVWQPEDELQNTIRYYWRVQAEDEHGITSEWTEPVSFFVKIDAVNDPPTITVTEPASQVDVNAAGPSVVEIAWIDEDADSSALIALYYDLDNAGSDGTVITEDISEDEDGDGDLWQWDVSGMPEGTWYVYGVISDGESSAVSYASGYVVIDRTAPQVHAEPVGGYMEQPVAVSLTADEQAAIYYTLDGTDPAEGSFVYDTPILVSQDTTIKFVAIDAVGNTSDQVEEVYSFNRAPIEPSDPHPENDAQSVSVDTMISWVGGDPDQGDTVAYDLYLGKNNPPLEKVADNISDTAFQVQGLDYSASYYWLVVARDSSGVETVGPVWHFATFSRNGDEDSDGLTNESEISLGTDPFDWDSDRDGYSDSQEAGSGTDPMDSSSRPSYPTSYGDINGDMVIDGQDLALLSLSMGSIRGDGNYNEDADFNQDGKVDAKDMDMFSRIFGYLFESG